MNREALSDTENTKFSVSKIEENKRALSDIVTTVLIILLVLAAVVIIWAFVRPAITEGSSKISSDIVTTSLSIQKNSVEIIDTDDLDTNTNTVELKVVRNAGGGEVVGYNVILEDEDGRRKVKKILVTAFKELETDSQTLNLVNDPDLTGLGKVVKVSVAPIVMSQAGKELILNPTSSYNEGTGVTEDNPPAGQCVPACSGSTPICSSRVCVQCTNDDLSACVSGQICNANNQCENQAPVATCGNVLETGEACDDGNTNSGDGCNVDCSAVESGWTCTGQLGGLSSCEYLVGDVNLIGHWRMDDFTDSSGNSNDLTCDGSASACPVAVSDFVEGSYSMQFVSGESDKLYKIGYSKISGQPFSISIWIKGSSQQVENTGIFASATSGTNTGSFQIDFGGTINGCSNGYRLFRKTTTGTDISCIGRFDVSPDDQWKNIIITYDGTNIKTYLNGALGGINTGALGYFNTIRIGSNRALGAYYNGQIDNVMLFDRVLTAQQVSDLYNSQKP